MPFLRALVAYWISASIVAAVELPCSKKALPRPLQARMNTGSGVVTSTAPRVPPITIMAAVACATS